MRPRLRSLPLLAAALVPALLLLAGCGPTKPATDEEAQGASGADVGATGTAPGASETDAPRSATRTHEAGQRRATPGAATSESPATEASGSAAPLVGTRWSWLATELPDDRRIAPRDPGAYTLAFLPEGALSAQADCNVATGSYARKGASLSIQIQAVTEAMCPEGSLSGEFLAMLGRAASYRLDGDGLVIDIGDGATLRMGPGAGLAPVR